MKKIQSILSHLDLLFNNISVVPRLCRNYFTIFSSKKNVLRKVDIALTFNCNANCHHCFSSSLRDSTKPELNLDQIFQLMKQSVKLGAIAFEMTGGEPLLHPHLIDIIRYGKKLKTIVAITTNGINLTEKKIKELENAGLDAIQLSLDSMCVEQHDQSRGSEGCYNSVLSAINQLQTSKIKIMLSTIATNENLEDNSLLQVIDYAKQINVPISLNPASQVGGWGNRKDILLSETNKNKYRELLNAPNVRWAGHMNFIEEGCPCGTETIFVTAYGDVLPCGFIQISYGNINQEPLSEIWKRFNEFPLGNHKKSICLAGLDDVFIKKYLTILNESKNLPISIFDHPEINKQS